MGGKKRSPKQTKEVLIFHVYSHKNGQIINLTSRRSYNKDEGGEEG